ncbi:hypothetical protein HUK80_13965 [Flavobacterium sp. MAH-1]|uniref:Uncharacterized protein n=1 Tax=Flavobacterium agri TaxID=2743471 RepID=A0A7Y9C6F6_9FLAO|nr:hypothetical protein [Flavobacterium agri]NUY82006.1 hypothetical protein [Flavobacterium agri]NYA72030.1 hypothetical protein [Flavobacterium agri]
MKKNYLLLCFVAIILGAGIFISCNHDDNEDEYLPVSPVVLDVTQVPYAKLSDYHFFDGGELKELSPSYKVLPYRPASELFTDYAHKKRFVWMPQGTKATFNGNDNTLEFPVGAVLIKNFYYDDVLPDHTTKIIETRILIKKREPQYNDDGDEINSGWEPYVYIWNDEQTEAFLDTEQQGVFVPVSFMHNGQQKDAFYKIPADTECRTCHKINLNETLNGEIVIPVGVKPQNLNYVYDYGTSQRNQLEKWVAEGYLENNIPATILSTVDYNDTSKPLELRARSYMDINCAHCHRQGGHCDYVNVRFNFSNSDPETVGICATPLFNVDNLPYVINAGDAANSEIIHRISSTDGSVMMPFIGRSIVHEEGVQLMTDWINSMQNHCN